MTEENNIQKDQEINKKLQEVDEVDSLKIKITELENNITQLKDQLLRKAAEFENYKKRIENDYATMVKFANEDLISSLLPALDDFYRSIKVSQEQLSNTTNKSSSDAIFLQGMELIYSKLMKILESQGVKQFDALGKQFDPFFHDALLQIPKHDVLTNTVIEEVEKGYMLNGKVIRHSRVIVSGEPKIEETTSQGTQTTRPSDSRNGMVIE